MATASDGSGSSGGEQRRLLSIPKEGERIIAPTRRPDGTLRKAIRIRAGYVPQEEVAIYQSKGALMRKSGPDVPPGYDPAPEVKPKTKAAKRNERRKEKRQLAALASTNDKGKSLDTEEDEMGETNEVLSSIADEQRDAVDAVTKQISGIGISECPVISASTDATDNSKSESSGPDIDKKIRALKKKIRLAEAQMQGDPEKLKPEQLEKTKKIEGWREELKLLEDKRATSAS